MSVAYDIRTGQLIGQVVQSTAAAQINHVMLLTRNGYQSVPAGSVRIVETR